MHLVLPRRIVGGLQIRSAVRASRHAHELDDLPMAVPAALVNDISVQAHSIMPRKALGRSWCGHGTKAQASQYTPNFKAAGSPR
ncbi:unnamed protein product [Peniophora sp. CBMAI 1063]|nr:unnamed protein product [Peniophora sp. CBMAI 1063]